MGCSPISNNAQVAYFVRLISIHESVYLVCFKILGCLVRYCWFDKVGPSKHLSI